MRLVDPYSPLGQWWLRQRHGSRFRRNAAVTAFLVVATGAGWSLAVMLTPADADGGSVAFYEVTSERRITVRESLTSPPRVKLLRSVKRVYVDPETIRSTLVVTTPGGVRTVAVTGRALLRTVPITRERVIMRAGRRITVAETVAVRQTVAVTHADIRTEVVTAVLTDVRVEREVRTERETQVRRETVTEREVVTERDVVTERETVTVSEPVTVVVTEEVPITVTVTEREPPPTEP